MFNLNKYLHNNHVKPHWREHGQLIYYCQQHSRTGHGRYFALAEPTLQGTWT